MAQITTGIRSILSNPLVYSFTQHLLGANKARKIYVSEYIRPSAQDKILDIGCGTADVLEFFPLTVEYFGFDLNSDYIEHAKNKFGSRGTFVCNDVNHSIKDLPKFDIILATGLLHHLNDHEATKLFTMAASALTKNGRLITFDCCYIPNQSKMAKFIISKDRGQNIRSPEGYQTFAKPFFEQVTIDVRKDLLRVPYTHVILECSHPSA